MSLSASRISSPEGIVKAIIQTDQILLVVDRHDIRLESDLLVLVKPPLKMYGITAPRTISFTFSTVDEIPDGVLTAHIGITARTPILQRIVLRIDQCFFTDIELPIGGNIIEKGSIEICENLLNPQYKGLLLNLFYTEEYYTNNPLLLDDDELDSYPFLEGGYKLQSESFDLELIIDRTLHQLGNTNAKRWSSYVKAWKEKHAEKQQKKEKKKNNLRIISFLKPFSSLK